MLIKNSRPEAEGNLLGYPPPQIPAPKLLGELLCFCFAHARDLDRARLRRVDGDELATQSQTFRHANRQDTVSNLRICFRTVRICRKDQLAIPV